jgi:hypothetical protein
MRDERERLAALATQDEAAIRQAESPRKPASGRDPAAKEERRRQAKMLELENQIAGIEAKLAEISRKLENRAIDPGEVVRLGKEYQSVQKEMDLKLAEWEAMQA